MKIQPQRLQHWFLILFAVLCPLFIASRGISQPSKPRLVLMCLSAHPDDEDGSALAYYAKLRGVKTYSIFFTRGEGGQNETGSELYEDLGALRTKETLEAAKILGSEVHFLGFDDFGFSKTAKETFSRWGGKDSVIARLVYIIRSLKPDVIITNHDTVTTMPNRQHGNHQAVGISAFEAFTKAADPRYHPEQLNDSVTVWQVKKLYFRSFRGDSTLAKNSFVNIDATERDSSGTSIEELAVHALNQHRSQGLSRLTLSSISPFFRRHHYILMRSDQQYPFQHNDLFSGLLPVARRTAAVRDFPTPPTPSDEQLRTLSKEQLAALRFSKKAVIGLIKTYDNTLEQTLRQFNIKYQLIDSTALANDNLAKYSTILLDLRTYFYRQDAVKYSDKLLQYVNGGGNIVCFYHKTSDWKPAYAPYPITITSERVTEEDAPVTILQPSHPLFNQPNRITSADWGSWVQERSIYLPSDDTTKTSSRYMRLLAMSDTDERQPSTSLLWTQYGKGTYTYVSLALYRQLRIEQEGALKLLFNLISQPKH